MASGNFWGVGPHTIYHGFGQEAIVAVYDMNSREQIDGAVIKNWWGYIEVLLPSNPVNGCTIVVVGNA